MFSVLFIANVFDFAGNFFLTIVLSAWVWLSTRASRLLHKCHEKVSVSVLKLVVADCCLVSVSVATGVSLVNIRLVRSSIFRSHQIFTLQFYISRMLLLTNLTKCDYPRWIRNRAKYRH